MDLCVRYRLIMIALATAASAAAMVMMNMVQKIPSSSSGHRYLLNATKLMFTLFNISSMLMSMVIMFLRVKRPNMPIKNNAVLTNNICSSGTAFILYLLDDFWFIDNGNDASGCMHFCF